MSSLACLRHMVAKGPCPAVAVLSPSTVVIRNYFVGKNSKSS